MKKIHCQAWHGLGNCAKFLQKFTNLTHKKKCGFTLAELLMATLVISIIMVALAPTITRRAHDNVAITVNQKQGLEIFSTPGIYTFDVPIGINTLFLQGAGGGGGGSGATSINKSLTFLTTQNFTVPKGVNKVNLTITGSGGGGGGGYARKTDESCVDKTTLFEYMADNGRDMCISEPQQVPNGANSGNISVVKMGESCVSQYCCWNEFQSGGCTDSTVGGVSGCNKTVCKYAAAVNWCIAYYSLAKDNKNYSFWARYSLPRAGRMITQNEARKILERNRLGYGGIEVCKHRNGYDAPSCGQDYREQPYDVSTVPTCYMGGQNSAIGSDNSYGYPAQNWLSGAQVLSMWWRDGCGSPGVSSYPSNENNAYSVFCAYELDNWNQYSGAGGASGAVGEWKDGNALNVLPGDILYITIGNGGLGGSAGNKGSNGGVTQVVHKRGSVEMGTYTVNGGLGGNPATSSANGAKYGDSTVHPANTCYQRKRKETSDPITQGNYSCKSRSQSGNAGTQTNGGNGAGVVNQSGSIAQGGGVDSGEGSLGTGYSATTVGFGGGGGTCARGVRNPASCSNGGTGKSGQVVIEYSIALPGAGGGAGTRVGGTTNEKANEIAYKVTEGTRVVVKIGAGGSGGVAGQNGTNGEPTIVGGDEIVFLGGEKGYVATTQKKTDLSNCIGNSANTTTIANCINNSSYKAVGGQSGVINDNDTVQSTTLGIVYGSGVTSKIKYTSSSGSFKGQAGKIPNYYSTSTQVPISYGFDGGVGGAPFGIASNAITNSVTCGGGTYFAYPATGATTANYVCTNDGINANRAKAHDPVSNEFGGSGGGGGGATGKTTDLGEGSSGASGYLRVRWNEAEQD